PEANAALPALKKVLSDGEAPVNLRTAVVEALGKMGKDAGDAVATLGALVSGEATDADLRRAAMTALDTLRGAAKAAFDDLKKAANDRDKYVRGLALRALGRLAKDAGGAKDVTEMLLKAVDDPAQEVRLAAVNTLGNLGKEALGGELEKAQKRLEELEKTAV